MSIHRLNLLQLLQEGALGREYKRDEKDRLEEKKQKEEEYAHMMYKLDEK